MVAKQVGLKLLLIKMVTFVNDDIRLDENKKTLNIFQSCPFCKITQYLILLQKQDNRL
jgi:hypothetical protein